MTMIGHPENKAIRPVSKGINAAASKSACAAEGVEEMEGDKEDQCHPCGEDTEAGDRSKIRVTTPYRPSQSEVDDHNETHLPYRSWCKHCIRGRGKEASHHQQTAEERTVPEFHMDFCFPGNEDSATEHLTVLVVRMRGTRMTMSTVVPSKSVDDFVTKRTVAFMRECGCEMTKLIIKTNQEPAILAIAEDVVRWRASVGADETIVENSVAYSHTVISSTE